MVDKELLDKIVQYITTGVDVSTTLYEASQDLKNMLAKARAAGKVTDEQWAELETKLKASEDRRRAAIAGLSG